MKAPVLLVGYKRPQHLGRVLAAVSAYAPSRLYVAIDGPGSIEDEEATRQVRDVIDGVSWPVEVKTRFRDRNLGVKMGPVDAITWFFEQEEAGIILEDDCLPSPDFFRYCEELLTTYATNPRVMCISGFRPTADDLYAQASYSFARSIGVWGWATWRRAWRIYDAEMRSWPAERDRDKGRWRASTALGASIYWKEILDAAHRGQIPSWDYQWVYACWSVNGVTCVPKVNLVENIGHGPALGHWASLDKGVSHHLEWPLVDPVDGVDERLDKWVDRHIHRVGSYPARRAASSMIHRIRIFNSRRDSVS